MPDTIVETTSVLQSRDVPPSPPEDNHGVEKNTFFCLGGLFEGFFISFFFYHFLCQISFVKVVHTDSKLPRVMCLYVISSFKIACFFYLHSSGIASCVGTAGMLTWCLHLTRPCYVPLGWVLIWVMCTDWFEELCHLGFLIPKILHVISCKCKWISYYQPTIGLAIL